MVQRDQRLRALHQALIDGMDTIFSTPGHRSFGDSGTLPQGDDFAGLVIAEYSDNEWREHVNYPCLGYMTVKGKGKDDAVTGLFLAC